MPDVLPLPSFFRSCNVFVSALCGLSDSGFDILSEVPDMAANKGLYAAYLEKVQGIGRSLAVAGLFCFLLVCAGCSGSAENAIASKLAGPRIDWGMSLTASGGNGVGQFPAKFTFDINAPVSAANCTTDFVAYNTGQPGGNGVATIVAYNSLYSTQGSPGGLCNTDGPSVYWAYNTSFPGSPDRALTSPVLALDGSKIAFVTNDAHAGNAVLRILKWKASQGSGVSAPATPDHDISGTAWSTCPANSSCIQSINFSGGITDSNSPPFYNYATDVLYVGDDNGGLHKFTGVFNGTPTEVTSSWPVEVNTSNSALTGPVFDSVSGNIYVGDSSGTLSMVREVGSSVGTCSAPCVNSTLNVGSGGSMVAPPIVDGTNQFVFAINGEENIYGGAMIQASTDFGTFDTFDVGNEFSPGFSQLYEGAFDNAYLNSSKPNVAGNLYICGHQHGPLDEPALYQFSFNSDGTIGGQSALNNLAQANGGACSPVTEIYNSGTSTDWVFFSIGAHARTGGAPIPAGGCRTDGNGCVIGINVTGSPSWPPANVNNTASIPANSAGGTSGIIVDNVSTSSQTSNIYFSLGGNSTGTGPGLPSCNTAAGVGCAVKLTQSALQ
jgi:hypothetical protein